MMGHLNSMDKYRVFKKIEDFEGRLEELEKLGQKIRNVYFLDERRGGIFKISEERRSGKDQRQTTRRRNDWIYETQAPNQQPVFIGKYRLDRRKGTDRRKSPTKGDQP